MTVKQKLDGLSALAKSGRLDELHRLIDEIWVNRGTAKTAEEDAKAAQKDALLILDQFGIEKVKTATGVRGSVVRSTRMQIDSGKLRRKLGQQRWAKVSTRQIDKSKLEQAIIEGLVDAVEVAECTDEIPGTPYIRTDPPTQRGRP